jgi:hypothetical protein
MEKLHIAPQTPSNLKAFDVMFNPTNYSITKGVNWRPQFAKSGSTTDRVLDAPSLVFGGGSARTMSLQLFCDVTEGPQKDVRAITNQLVALSRIEPGLNQPQPPVIKLSWGADGPQGSDFPFTGVVTNLQQSFVLFHSSGAPLRANITMAVMEFIDPEQNLRQNDPDLTTYTVRRGDSLSQISARMYRDPALWRLIAAANGLDDPRRLVVGARLTIPEKP